MRKIFLAILTILGLVLLIGCAKKTFDANDSHSIGTFSRGVEVDGETREYLIHMTLLNRKEVSC